MTKNEIFSRVRVKYDANAFSAFVDILNKDDTKDLIKSLESELVEIFPNDLDRLNYPIIEKEDSLTQFGKLLVMRLSVLLYKEFKEFIVSQKYKQKFSNAKSRNNSNDKIFRNFLSRLTSASFAYQIHTHERDPYRTGILHELIDRYFYKDIINIIEGVKKDVYLNQKEIKAFMSAMNKVCNGINVNTYLECFTRYSNINRFNCTIKFDGGKEYKLESTNYGSLYFSNEIPAEDYLFTLFDLNPNDYKNNQGYLVSMIRFISALESYEPAKYEKLCSYIVGKIKTMEFGGLCLEKGYNISLADRKNYIHALTRFILNRFTRVGRYEIKVDNYEYLAYPAVEIPEEVLVEGRKISDEMLSNYFSGDDLSKAKELFYNPETTIDINHGSEVTIGSCILGAFEKKTYDFVPNYDSYENRYNRLYIWCYLYKHGSAQYKAMLWERIFSYLIRSLASKYNLHSVFEEDDEKHQEVLDVLFKSLNRFGIDTSKASDQFKKNCLISLMDYSYSTLEQDSMFPVLEQLGDAVFDVVVTNLLYLDPRIRAKNLNDGTNCMKDIDSLKKKYCSADEQTNIAKELKLNEIYLVSDLDFKETSNKEKSENMYANYDLYHAKYFADSYEMIIGSICKEYGLDVAYKFAEDTFLSVYPDFKPIKELSSMLDANGNNLEKLQAKLEEICSEYEFYQFLQEAGDYLLTVKPDFRVKFSDDSYLRNLTENNGGLDYRILKISLMKLACIIILGNDTKEQRSKLIIGTHNFRAKNQELSIDSIAVYEFLHNGIVAMVDSVRDNSETDIA